MWALVNNRFFITPHLETLMNIIYKKNFGNQLSQS